MPLNFPMSSSSPPSSPSHDTGLSMGASAAGIGPSGSIPSMEKTFITMHDLSSEAQIVYASDSIADVLGYPPEEVIGLSCFDFFHPDELPFARKIHNRGIHLDKAAVLVYCRVKHKDGRFIHCETIFSVVYDVFVAATTLHVQTSKSQGRALTAPVIRRVFSSSPNDPRYHMLTHLSAKFHMGNPENQATHEPRVALILNRFTRTLTVLYASHACSSIFGIAPNQLTGKSFFECIHEDCLQEAVDALERAKENDSIAYLRFHWRDPIGNAEAERTRAENPAPVDRPLRRSRRISSQTKRRLENDDRDDAAESSVRSSKRRALGPRGEDASGRQDDSSISRLSARAVSPVIAEASGSAARGSTLHTNGTVANIAAAPLDREVEAVVSCTSDGLVVVLRQARPLIPRPLHNVPNGIFASPWAPMSLGLGSGNLSDKNREAEFMEAIQEVAVFAWSLRQLGGEIIPNAGDEKSDSHADTKSEVGVEVEVEVDGLANGDVTVVASDAKADQNATTSITGAANEHTVRREPRNRSKAKGKKPS